MARIARVVITGIPHHITLRGNRRMQTFFNNRDHQAYVRLMAEWFREFQAKVWAYCLMPNHVHLTAVAEREHRLRHEMVGNWRDFPDGKMSKGSSSWYVVMNRAEGSVGRRDSSRQQETTVLAVDECAVFWPGCRPTWAFGWNHGLARGAPLRVSSFCCSER